MKNWMNGLPKTRMAILRVVLGYFLVSSAWIAFSDHVVGWITQNPDQIVILSTYKGMAFVIVTSILLFVQLRTEILKLEAEMEMRRKISEDLRQSSEQISAILSSSPLAIVAIDRNEKIQIWNPAAEQIFGWKAAEVIEKPLPIVPEEYSKESHEIISKVFSGQVVRNYETRRCAKDGRLIDVIISSAPVHNYQEEITLLMGIYIDNTARKQAEEKLHRLSIELEQRVQERTADLAVANQHLTAQVEERERAERELLAAQARLSETNKELEAFSYSVSHDLRAPLRQIAGYASLLMEEAADRLDDQSHEDLMRIHAGVGQMNELIDALLTLSRVTRGTIDLVSINLTEMAAEIVHVLRQQDPSRSVEIILKPGLFVTGDPRMVRILLTNLFENAWKFTKTTDSSTIELGSLEKKGTRTVVFLRDTGIGFDMSRSDRMFKPFQRFHSASEFPGSGIGLATVARIVQRHGGEVWAKGEPGNGATFFFTLGME